MGVMGVDAGICRLVSLTRPVPGLTDGHGRTADPRVLEKQLGRLAQLDRKLARCQKGSTNRSKVEFRRARQHGTIATTRALELDRITNALAGSFDTVVIQDLNVAGVTNKKRHLGRGLADVALAELRRQLTYTTSDRGSTLVTVNRFSPSSKTCSACGAVKAKLHLSVRVFECSTCGMSLDRDVNAAVNIEAEGRRLLEAQLASCTISTNGTQDVAGLRPETIDAGSRMEKTECLGAPRHQPFAGQNHPAGYLSRRRTWTGCSLSKQSVPGSEVR